MPLVNFGSILGFAAELAERAQAFYRSLAETPRLAEKAALFGRLAADEKKNRELLLRTRRENVTEMILEPVEGFRREPFVGERGEVGALTLPAALALARHGEEKAAAFHAQAAAKLSALPEVARALRNLAKRHQARLAELA